MKEKIICPRCGKLRQKHSKNLCKRCYRKYIWKQKKIICRRCKREIYLHAKGMCGGCYNTIFHLERTKAYNYKRKYNLPLEVYKKITNKCTLCGFDKVVDLHHIDESHKNNSEKNLIGLCPNHHQMLHTLKYKNEILGLLKEKGVLPREGL